MALGEKKRYKIEAELVCRGEDCITIFLNFVLLLMEKSEKKSVVLDSVIFFFLKERSRPFPIMDGNPDEKNKSSLFLASQVSNLPPNMSGAAL